MALEAEARLRYARHLLLAEVGEAGQARLGASSASLAGDARAVEVASLYLGRAGVSIVASAPLVDVRSPDEVLALAGRDELREAAAFLAGAFAAVEVIKRALAVGTPGRLEAALTGPAEDP